MSVLIANVDLSMVSVGSTGTINFDQYVSTAATFRDSPAHIRCYNESNAGLAITFDDGHQEIIPAGGWATHDIVDDQFFNWQVLYLMSTPQVAKLLVVFYYPNEAIPDPPILGNSPIGGSVTTPQVSTLSNEAGSVGNEIIDIGPTTFSKLIDIFNDHFIWSVLQAGVAHQVLKGQTSGNPLQIGEAGDITEILGALTVDQQAVFNGADPSITIPNSTSLSSKDAGGTVRGLIGIDNTNNVHIRAAGANTIDFNDNAGNIIAFFDNNGNFNHNNKADYNMAYIQFNTAGVIHGVATGTVSIGASSTVAVSHGLGATPQCVLAVTDQSGSSGTCSAFSYTSTQFSLLNGAGATLVYRWFAFS